VTASDPASVAVVGATGFVGSAVVRHLTGAGWSVRPVTAPRISAGFGDDAARQAGRWADADPSRWASLVAGFAGVDVVINAAGLAAPTAPATDELWGANAVLPAVVARAAGAAGAPRLVHISSAAVQGSRPTLDEEPYDGRGHSPYARAKGAGELAVLAESDEAVVYRATSVLGPGRPIAARLAAVLRSRWLVVPDADVPLPVAHIDHAAAAVAFVAALARPARITLHPWEQMTVASLATAFGRTEPIRHLPGVVYAVAGPAVGLLARRGPLAGQARRIELLWAGQRQSSVLPGLGFAADPGDAYIRLGHELVMEGVG
jgi:nucleoside-diphosphate-sugar epimerase